MIPGMIAAGYRKDDAAAVSATGGTLGILIPPSNPMIIYGVVANTSIAGLFMASGPNSTGCRSGWLVT